MISPCSAKCDFPVYSRNVSHLPSGPMSVSLGDWSPQPGDGPHPAPTRLSACGLAPRIALAPSLPQTEGGSAFPCTLALGAYNRAHSIQSYLEVLLCLSGHLSLECFLCWTLSICSADKLPMLEIETFSILPSWAGGIDPREEGWGGDGHMVNTQSCTWSPGVSSG